MVLDSYRPHYQNLLIRYLKFIAKNGEIKIVNLNVILLGLKIIDYITSVKNVNKDS